MDLTPSYNTLSSVEKDAGTAAVARLSPEFPAYFINESALDADTQDWFAGRRRAGAAVPVAVEPDDEVAGKFNVRWERQSDRNAQVDLNRAVRDLLVAFFMGMAMLAVLLIPIVMVGCYFGTTGVLPATGAAEHLVSSIRNSGAWNSVDLADQRGILDLDDIKIQVETTVTALAGFLRGIAQ